MTKSYPTLHKIRSAHGWKRDYEKCMPLSRYVYRPIGFLVTWMAVRVGITTEGASWLSGIFGISGILCLMGKSIELIWIGIGLLMFFNLFDCVDGSIARVMRTENPYGKFLDSVLGDVVDFAFFGALGILTYRHPQLLYWPFPFNNGSIFWIVISGLTAFFYVLLRHIEHLFEHRIWELEIGLHNVASSPGKASQNPPFGDQAQNQQDRSLKDLLRLMDRNLKVRENHYLFLIIAVCLRVVDIFLLFFLFYYLLHTVVTGAVYFHRAKKVRDMGLK